MALSADGHTLVVVHNLNQCFVVFDTGTGVLVDQVPCKFLRGASQIKSTSTGWAVLNGSHVEGDRFVYVNKHMQRLPRDLDLRPEADSYLDCADFAITTDGTLVLVTSLWMWPHFKVLFSALVMSAERAAWMGTVIRSSRNNERQQPTAQFI